MERFYTIRQVRTDDLDAVADLEADCFPRAEAADRESLRERIEAFPESFLVAEDAETGELIGMVNGGVTNSRTIRDEMFEDAALHDPHGDWQSIFGLDVRPGFRGRRVAQGLMEAFAQLAAIQGRKGLILTCKEHLIGFYESLGYTSMGRSASVHGGAVWYDMILEFDR